jgi:ATP-dependent Lon protease
MEVLHLAGYTEDEKVKIARRYLLPRQLEAHGLSGDHLTLSDGAIRRAISGYTREAGLRNLEREIGTICRGVARKVAEGRQQTERVTARDIHKFLGPIRFHLEVKERTSIPGVAAGLAWTETGGDILFVEAAGMKGKQSLTLTGQLGEVMKESARAALTYIRSRAKELDIPQDVYEDQEIHIHVPAGAIPKDGPSAGVTMLTALVSLLTGKTVDSNTAMTGEITLRGQVLPVGGIKEKVLAAHRAGISRVILPKWNEKDVADIPQNVRKKMRFHFVNHVAEVIRIAFSNGTGKYPVEMGSQKSRQT